MFKEFSIEDGCYVCCNNKRVAGPFNYAKAIKERDKLVKEYKKDKKGLLKNLKDDGFIEVKARKKIISIYENILKNGEFYQQLTRDVADGQFKRVFLKPIGDFLFKIVFIFKDYYDYTIHIDGVEEFYINNDVPRVHTSITEIWRENVSIQKRK